MRRPAAAVLLAASLTACAGDGEEPPSLTAPAVFYLRPQGDKAGVRDKMPYELKA
ncbi:hypothetical protein [Streptomyces sp. NPDC087859]